MRTAGAPGPGQAEVCRVLLVKHALRVSGSALTPQCFRGGQVDDVTRGRNRPCNNVTARYIPAHRPVVEPGRSPSGRAEAGLDGGSGGLRGELISISVSAPVFASGVRAQPEPPRIALLLPSISSGPPVFIFFWPADVLSRGRVWAHALACTRALGCVRVHEDQG